MKWLAIFVFTLSFSLSAATKAELDLVVKIHNEKIKTVDGLINKAIADDKLKGEELRANFKRFKIPGERLLPQLIVVDNYLTFKDYKGPDFKMTPLDHGGITIEFNGKSTDFNITMSLAELDNFFVVSQKSKEIRESMIEMLFPAAHADDLGSTIMHLGGTAGYDMRPAAYGTSYAVNEMHLTIKERYKNWKHKGIRTDAEEACKDIQEGKKVKNSEKLIEKLASVKKEIVCISYWPATSTRSCAYYDEKIACISGGVADTVNDASRGTKVVAPTKSSEPKIQNNASPR